MVLLECKTENRHSQCDGANKKPVLHVQLRCGRCQSQHQCHIWRMDSMFEANCVGKLAWQLSIKFCVIHEAMNSCKNLKAC